MVPIESLYFFKYVACIANDFAYTVPIPLGVSPPSYWINKDKQSFKFSLILWLEKFLIVVLTKSLHQCLV